MSELIHRLSGQAENSRKPVFRESKHPFCIHYHHHDCYCYPEEWGMDPGPLAYGGGSASLNSMPTRRCSSFRSCLALPLSPSHLPWVLLRMPRILRFFFLLLKRFITFYSFIGSVCAYATEHVWKFEDNVVELVLSFHYVGPRD